MKLFVNILTLFLILSGFFFLKEVPVANAVDSCKVLTSNVNYDPASPIVAGIPFKVTFPGIYSRYGNPQSLSITVTAKDSPYGIGLVLNKGSNGDGSQTLDKGLPTAQYYAYQVSVISRGFDIKCTGSLNVTEGTCALQSDGQSIDQSQTKCGTGYVPVAFPSDGISTAACVCEQQSGPTFQGNGFGKQGTCKNNPSVNGIDTDFGCIPTDPGPLASALLRFGVGIAGAIAILFIIIGGFKVASSGGDPDALDDGRAMISHAIIGLVFILLATVILGIIGIDILGISFFSRSGTNVTITQ